jgi:hypothetical protein
LSVVAIVAIGVAVAVAVTIYYIHIAMDIHFKEIFVSHFREQ